MLFFIVLVIGIVLVFYLASYEEVAPILLGILVGGISFLLFDFPFYWSVILSITVGIVFLAMHENAKIFWIQSLFIFIILSITSFKLFNWLNFKIIQCIIAALIYSIEAVNLYMYSNNNRNNMFTLDSLLLCNGIDKEIEVANFCSQNSTIPSSFVESLFLKAVKKDDLNNKLQYANYLSTKKDVRRLYQAYVYYEEAVTNGMDEYELNMEEIISKICSVLEKNISTYSFKNYEEIYIKCAEYGNLKCQEKVANNYFQINSSLVENEHLVAFKYYLNLVNNNVLYNPFFKLAECYRLGIGTHKNFQLAGDYYKIFIESISEDNYLKNKYRDEYNTAKKHLQKLYDMNYWEKESLNIPVNQDDNLSEEEKMLIYMNEKYSKTGGLIAAGLYDEAALNFRLILEGFLTSMLNLSGLECSEERSFDRIEFLEKNSVIDSTISSYCHRIRKIGNEGAHLSSNTSLNKSILFNISNITNKLISYFSTEITKNN